MPAKISTHCNYCNRKFSETVKKVKRRAICKECEKEQRRISNAKWRHKLKLLKIQRNKSLAPYLLYVKNLDEIDPKWDKRKKLRIERMSKIASLSAKHKKQIPLSISSNEFHNIEENLDKFHDIIQGV